MDKRLDNRLHFLCTIIEYTARRTNNHRGDIVKQIGFDGLDRELYNAEVNCALSYEQISDENIEDYHITTGTFDTTSNLKYRIPSVAMIGRVYADLIKSLCSDCSDESKLIETMNEVFCSWISDAISDFDSVFYYSNPDYLVDSYMAGYRLDN